MLVAAVSPSHFVSKLQVSFEALMNRLISSRRMHGVAIALIAAGPVWALDKSKGTTGSNHERAHAAPHMSAGDAIRVGVIEVEGGIDLGKTRLDDDGRLIKNLNFQGLSTPVGVEPPAVNAGAGAPLVTDHATLVGDVIGSSHATFTGLAPGSRIYTAATDSNASIFAGIEYFSRTESVGIFNMSLGGPARTIADTAPHRTGVQTLNAAGDTAEITTAADAFDFTGQTMPTQLDRMSIRLFADDGDTGRGLIPPAGGPPPPNDFDFDNLQLQLDNVNLPFSINGLRNGGFFGGTFTFDLTPMQSASILGQLGDNKLHARLRRVADLPDTDSPLNDNSGNRIEFDNAAGANGTARLSFMQFNNNGGSQLALSLDRIAFERDLLIVKSAGNNGDGNAQITDPGDFMNGITVGATDSSQRARARFSSYWLAGDTGAAPDLGHKPEILAPGTSVFSQSLHESGTSFAAPHVAGAAALVSKGTERTPGGLPLGTTVDNHLAVKAILMNSARKRFISQPENEQRMAEDFPGTGNEASDNDYLNPDGTLRTIAGPKTVEWTPSSWSVDNTGPHPVFSTNRPLDDEQGSGLLDAERALIQLDGGEQEPGPVNYIGWDRGVLNTGAEVEYRINHMIPKGAFITATLVWDRIVGVTEADGSASDDMFEANDLYSPGFLPDFDLFLDFQGQKIAESVSFTSTVEHLHIPAVDFGEVLDYSIRLRLFGGQPTAYALAWWTVPEPLTAALIVMAVVPLLTRRSTRSRF
jgi:subtilisin family serine protease